jgi:YidC/Oxa1 family membrane protein insertase
MQQNNKNFLLFLVVSLLLFILWENVRRRIWPPVPQPEPEKVAAKVSPDVLKGLALGGTSAAKVKREYVSPTQRRGLVMGPAAVLNLRPRPKAVPLVTLGEESRDSRFHLKVVFDPRSAGVVQVILNKFQAADAQGRAEWLDEAKKEPRPLELVPREANERFASNLLYAFDVTEPNEDRPLDVLGRNDAVAWHQIGAVAREKLDDGRERQRIDFQAETQGVIVTKTFTLTEGEYHVGLEVKMERKAGADRPVKFRYQLSGAHGLPIEGKWYTSVFRNALIGRVDRVSAGADVWRDLQETRQISLKAGGDPVLREDKRIIRYAAVAVQFFTSAIVVDDDQKKQDFLAKARPTLEIAVVKGTVKKIDKDKNSFDLVLADKSEQTFFVDPEEREPFFWFKESAREGARVAITFYTDSHLRQVAIQVGNEARTQPLWIEDLTVRVATEGVELKPGEAVTHKYLLYNGPVKPMLLGKMSGVEAVPPELVNRYVDGLRLNTLTDYHSPGWMGSFASAIYWTNLIIFFTNLMHGILSLIHTIIPSYGLAIICLTVLVRGLMFPISRKQALTTMKMQELAPEIKKLQEKFKDDRQQLGMAQMALYRKHGVNPFGTCWFLLLQMPIFMGLYYALQESIFFRLAPFWPTWISNLAAPDMMIHWGDKIPWISRPEDYGGLLYLGPYFNLLPVIAVTLMLLQQKMMTPPPTDEQQAMQFKIMRYMMIFFGLLFYKVAAGLCVYFIASSLWGFAERKLLPKKKLQVGTTSAESLFQRMRGKSEEATPAAVTTNGGTSQPGRGKRKKDRAKGRPEPSPIRDGNSSVMQRLRAWWADVLKQAKKK